MRTSATSAARPTILPASYDSPRRQRRPAVSVRDRTARFQHRRGQITVLLDPGQYLAGGQLAQATGADLVPGPRCGDPGLRAPPHRVRADGGLGRVVLTP